MKIYNFKKIDAFATEKSSGNPAGYILLDSLNDITESEMLQIAKELKGFVNEVGYVCKTAENHFSLKYYSSEREVDFCGHATIAIMYDILKSDASLHRFENIEITTNRGLLKVQNRIEKENAVFIYSPEPIYTDIVPDLKEIEKNLKLNEGEINSRLPISIINAGLASLIVPIVSLRSILKISPDLDELKKFCIQSKIDIIEVFTGETSSKLNNYRTRVFAPTFGYLEDPATGSGNSALGYYLLSNNLWNGETISIEQNNLMDNYNIIKLQKQKEGNENTMVLFGGAAINRIEGKYILYEL